MIIPKIMKIGPLVLEFEVVYLTRPFICFRYWEVTVSTWNHVELKDYDCVINPYVLRVVELLPFRNLLDC